jgi:RimJ/RimL family protein N-acetyltransferase
MANRHKRHPNTARRAVRNTRHRAARRLEGWSSALDSDTIPCMPLLTSDVVAAGTFGSGAQPTIPTGSGLVLRPWTPSDAPAVFEAFADPEIRRWHVRATSSRDEVETWIDSWVADWPGGAQAHWAVADSHTNELVGRASLKNIKLVSGQGEVAYWTMPARRRQRVASRAVEALTRWAFGEVGFHRLELTHSVHNSSSCRVAVRTGFDLEGTKRGAGLHLDGWHDIHLHARLSDD